MNRFILTGASALFLLATPAAWSAPGSAAAAAQQQYRLERDHCMSGQSNQDRPTCLKEAGAAYAEARRGLLANEAGANLARNATERCRAQPEADREACVQRIIGPGSTSGSVLGGGVIRETTTVIR